MTSTRLHLGAATGGLLLGLALSLIGFSDWDEVHRMFTLESPRLFLVFGGGVALCAAAYAALGARFSFEPRNMHPGVVPGGLLFGIGWAVTGACPAVALVALGEGKVLAGFTLAGMLAGTWLFERLRPRYFKWESTGCGI